MIKYEPTINLTSLQIQEIIDDFSSIKLRLKEQPSTWIQIKKEAESFENKLFTLQYLKHTQEKKLEVDLQYLEILKNLTEEEKDV